MKSFTKINSDDFIDYITLLENKILQLNKNKKYICYKIKEYDEINESKGFFKNLFEIITLKYYEEYLMYNDYLFEVEQINHKIQRAKTILSWFDVKINSLYISIDDYNFIFEKEESIYEKN